METAQSLWATWLSSWGRSFSLYPPFSTSLLSFHIYCLLSYCCALLQRVFDPMKTPVLSGPQSIFQMRSSTGCNLCRGSFLAFSGCYGPRIQVGHERGDGVEQEGDWMSSQHSLVWRRVKASAAGGQEKLYVCLPWGCEVGDEF